VGSGRILQVSKSFYFSFRLLCSLGSLYKALTPQGIIKYTLIKHREELDPGIDIGSVLTLSGRFNHAIAMPREEYMGKTWPRTGTEMLEAVKDALKSKVCSKYFFS